jgi:hypothetical protein
MRCPVMVNKTHSIRASLRSRIRVRNLSCSRQARERRELRAMPNLQEDLNEAWCSPFRVQLVRLPNIRTERCGPVRTHWQLTCPARVRSSGFVGRCHPRFPRPKFPRKTRSQLSAAAMARCLRCSLSSRTDGKQQSQRCNVGTSDCQQSLSAQPRFRADSLP